MINEGQKGSRNSREDEKIREIFCDFCGREMLERDENISIVELFGYKMKKNAKQYPRRFHASYTNFIQRPVFVCHNICW
jgi:hypothetical protein